MLRWRAKILTQAKNFVLANLVDECCVQNITLIHNSYITPKNPKNIVSRKEVGEFQLSISSNTCVAYGRHVLLCISHTLHLLYFQFFQPSPLIPRSSRTSLLPALVYVCVCLIRSPLRLNFLQISEMWVVGARLQITWSFRWRREGFPGSP